MGFFDIFKKKSDPELTKDDLNELSGTIARSFNKAREADENLSQKIDHMYIKHETLQTKHDKNLTLMLSWFEHFRKMHTEHKQEINVMKTDISQLQDKLQKIEKIDDEFIKNIVEQYITLPKTDKEELEEDLFEELTNVREMPKEVQTIVKEIQTTLTKSELEILNMLYNSNLPLSYADLAYKVRKSPSTVKVYLNALKNKGIELEEHSAPRGIKLYSISSKEKIRKFYNLG